MNIEDAFKKAGIGKPEKPASEDMAKGVTSQNEGGGFETPGKKPVSVAEAKKVLFEGPRKTFHAGEREVRVYSRYAEDIERKKKVSHLFLPGGESSILATTIEQGARKIPVPGAQTQTWCK